MTWLKSRFGNRWHLKESAASGWTWAVCGAVGTAGVNETDDKPPDSACCKRCLRYYERAKVKLTEAAT